MKYPKTLIHGRLIRRYKRFLADVTLDDGRVVTAHCTNSGSMKSCLEEGAEVFLSPVDDPARKTQFTWEMIRIHGRWVGINTSVPNRITLDWMGRDMIPGLEGYHEVRREVKFMESRLDIFARRENGETCFVEVKNVTLKQGRYALFPDAVTLRGQKHLQSLMEARRRGHRAVMLYVIQRTDVDIFGPAKEIDPQYAVLLKQAMQKGVEVIPLQVQVSPEGVEPYKVLEVDGQ